MLYEIYPASAKVEALCQSLGIERSLSQKERDAIDEEDFAGPHHSFPIDTQEHLDAAAHLIGHAEDPEAVKRKAIAIAKRKGFTLPKAWQDEEGGKDKADRAMTAADPVPATDDGAPHPPMADKHEPTSDNVHRTDMPTHALLYAPITRIDPAKREVEGVATSEAVDSFGTIFSYEASKRAFQRWIERTANCREMHDRKAVGKGIGVYFDDAKKQIHVRSRISRSADGENTWIKFQEGILNGYSVGAINPVWDTVERDGKSYPYLVSYDLSELSYVDNASNPDAQGLVLCRADGLTDLVDVTTEEPAAPPPSSGALPASASLPVERAGARVSSSTRDGMHESIKHTLHAATSQMKNCGCDACSAAMSLIDPDQDGDIDLGGYDDPDGDWQSLYAHKDGDMDRAVTAALERVLPGVIERMLSPVYQRQQQFLARMAQVDLPESLEPPTLDTTALEERITAAIERAASASNLSEVRASLSEQSKALEAVRETVERIEKQPMPGGPVLSGGGHPVEKRLATSDPRAGAPGGELTPELRQAFWSDLQRRGLLNTTELQMAAAADSIVAMPGRRG